MKSGSMRAIQSHIARSKPWYVLFGLVILAKAAVESSACSFSCTPILLKSVWMIWNVRGML